MTEKPALADLRAALDAQHVRIRALLEHVLGSAPPDRAAALSELTRFLVIHESGEHAALHAPSLAHFSDTELAGSRLQEEEHAGHILQRLAELGVDSAAFATQVDLLLGALDRHARAEEQEELPAFAAQASAAEQQRLVGTLRRIEELFAERGPRATVPVRATPAQQRAAAARAFPGPDDDVARPGGTSGHRA